MTKQLHAYQQRGVEHIENNPKSGLFFGMGMGKTVTTLTAIERLMYSELEVLRVLVVATKMITETVWTDEVQEWPHLSHLRISRIIGSQKQRDAACTAEADIYIISRDNVVWLTQNHYGLLRSCEMLVIDELSSFKNPQAQRFKALRKYSAHFKRVVGLTGTPANNSYLDLWPEVYLLDKGERLGKTLTSYRNNYFLPDKRNGEIIYSYKLREGARATIEEKLSDICLSMQPEDYLELPPVNYINRYVEMSGKLMKEYKYFEDNLILQLNEDVNAANAAALTNKCLQFANGAIYDEERNVVPLHDSKLELLHEIIDEAEGGVMIAYWFKHDLIRLQESLIAYHPRTYEGEQTKKDWNDGRIRVLLVHPLSVGHGLNLQRGGHTLIWFALHFSLESYLQTNARLARQGQQFTVNIVHLLTRNTIDEHALDILQSKDAGQRGLLEALRDKLAKNF